jgi:hypothetical protein
MALYLKIRIMTRKEKWFKAGLLIMLCGGLYAFQLLKTAPTTMTLEQAIAKKMVNCRMASTGKYSGESVALTLTNLTGTPLNITIPNGTVFKPSEDEDQDLIIVDEQQIALNAKATTKQIVDGFCMEPHDSSPTPENGMKLSRNTNPKLQELTAFMNGKKYDSDIIQDAVWAVADGDDVSSIDNSDEKGKALRTFVAKLINKPDPWYSKKQERVVTPERVIESNPVMVNGMITIETEGAMKINEVVKKSNGQVMNTSEEMEFPKKGKWNYQFTLTVKGWEKGDYVVNVLSGTKLIKAFPFKI